MRHKFLVMSLVGFVACLILAQFVEVASETGRKQHFSQGRELDSFVKKTILTNDILQWVTYSMRYYMNISC